jgi:hypothetical protein
VPIGYGLDLLISKDRVFAGNIYSLNVRIIAYRASRIEIVVAFIEYITLSKG